MKFHHIAGDPFVNVSEELACQAVEAAMRESDRPGTAYLITNLTRSFGAGRRADEIDMVLIGPGGVGLVEVKHWDGAKRAIGEAAREAAHLADAKAKRLKGFVEALAPTVGFVSAAFLFTDGVRAPKERARRSIDGVSWYALGEARDLVAPLLVATPGFNPDRVATALAPRRSAESTGRLRQFERFRDLRLLSPAEERFVRVYAARDSDSAEPVTLHLYDLSARGVANPLPAAEREAKVLVRFQKSAAMPKVIDTFQPAPGRDELRFFTTAESGAKTLDEAMLDPAWDQPARAEFAGRAFAALAALHEEGEEALVHRALSRETVRVRADNTPLFSGWRWARLPDAATLAIKTLPAGIDAAPEVVALGPGAADIRSDVYSLASALKPAFDPAARGNGDVLAALELALAQEQRERPSATQIVRLLEAAPVAPPRQPAVLPPAFWDDGVTFSWRDRRYRVLARLGQGATGTTFKLCQLGRDGEEPIGTYVGKVIGNSAAGAHALDVYERIRDIADHEALSGIYEIATEWSADELAVLLKWRGGEPLGSVPALIGSDDDARLEERLLGWAEFLLGGLASLHRAGWVHGDVSTGNILVDDGAEHRATLIDFDLATRAGEVADSPGTLTYASPQRRRKLPASRSDDVYALAASLFHALSGREPFLHAGRYDPEAGLAWGDNRDAFPRFVRFCDAACAAQPDARLADADAALAFLRALREPTVPVPSASRAPMVVPRVREILRSYAGSQFGNSETRGLDSAFAIDTYVETELDVALREDIQAGCVSLVILCGNAGDGKTALLQHLAVALGLPEFTSQNRVHLGELGARKILFNLDGAAAWRDLSANALLSQVFAPFHDGDDPGRVHLVAVNDGRLMEWIEHHESQPDGPSRLTTELKAALGEGAPVSPHIRFVELNRRSLVGGIDRPTGTIRATFMERLVERLVGSRVEWQPCETCTALSRCEVRRAAELLGVSDEPEVRLAGRRLQERLAAALQAVHQRNEVHITARELKGALSYILFGIHDCEAITSGADRPATTFADRAFDPDSPRRQGDLLRELTQLDPALVADARADRHLVSDSPVPGLSAQRYSRANVSLRSARRRAYFDWTDAEIEAVTGDPHGVGLVNGRHLAAFRAFPMMHADEQGRVRDELCRGLSRLEDLPPLALSRMAVPIKILPRTKTETEFWVEKPLEAFTLAAEVLPEHQPIEMLHRHLVLSCRLKSGGSERLVVSLTLFSLLRDIADGLQLIDARSDEVFSNIATFTQRLAQEDERQLYAWNPAEEHRVYEVAVRRTDGIQRIVLEQRSA